MDRVFTRKLKVNQFSFAAYYLQENRNLFAHTFITKLQFLTNQ